MTVSRLPGIGGLWSAEETTCRGPVGVYDDISGVCRAETRSALGMVEYQAPMRLAEPRRMNMLCLDVAHLAGFIHSVARARATAQHLRIRWVQYKDSSIMNFVYAMQPWKGVPGWAEVDLGSQAAIDRDTQKYVDRYQQALMRKVDSGPQSVARWLMALDETRDDCIQNTREVFKDATSLNAEVQGATADYIRTVATIKLASDVVIARYAPFWLDIGYSVLTTAIKSAAEGDRVDAVAFKSTETAGKELAEEAMDQVSQQWGRRAGQIGEEIAQIEGRIAERSAAIARKVKKGAKGAHTIQRTVRHLREDVAYVRKGQNRALRKQKVFKGFKLAFVAADVMSAISEYHETLTGLD